MVQKSYMHKDNKGFVGNKSCVTNGFREDYFQNLSELILSGSNHLKIRQAWKLADFRNTHPYVALRGKVGSDKMLLHLKVKTSGISLSCLCFDGKETLKISKELLHLLKPRNQPYSVQFNLALGLLGNTSTTCSTYKCTNSVWALSTT